MQEEKTRVLFSFVGNRDPYNQDYGEEYGPVLSLLEIEDFHRVYLFIAGENYLERAREVEEIAKGFEKAIKFFFISIELKSVVDYEEIFSKLKESLSSLESHLPREKTEYSVLLDPGTPQMQTSWFLLVRSGIFNARLLQGIPSRFAGGAYKVKEIRLGGGVLPEIHLTEKNESTSAFYGAEETVTTEPDKEEVRYISSRTRFIGESDVFRKMLQSAERIASYDVTVLLTGETGTGKGMVAQFIHDRSRRRNKIFLPVNCASVSPTLAESELFGHRKGAFTGADSPRLGYFRSAAGGTIFLDEVGDLSAELQAKLLRVLEDGTVFPLGADHEEKVDLRIMAATNKNLGEMMDEGLFRRDLYERLNEINLELPPLRERGPDIPLLINVFLDEWNKRYHEEKTITEEAMKYLIDYNWPGNIRELQNAIRSLCAGTRNSKACLGPEFLPSSILSFFNKKREIQEDEIRIPEDGMDIKARLYQIERDYYLHALEKCGGNREKAALLLGINPPAFRKALRERFNYE